MDVKKEIEIINGQIETLKKRIKFLRENRAALKALPEAHYCGDRLDFDRLSHSQVVSVIRKLGGKWAKTETYCSDPSLKGRIDYEAKIDGMDVRCWAGEAPPSCRIVEVEEQVPEQVIPAHTRKVRKLICTGKDDPLVASIARAQPQ